MQVRRSGGHTDAQPNIPGVELGVRNSGKFCFMFSHCGLFTPSGHAPSGAQQCLQPHALGRHTVEVWGGESGYGVRGVEYSRA